MRLVDIDKARKEYSNLTDLTMSDTTLLLTLFGVLDNATTVEAIPKADYENRLKADLVAMLEVIKLRIDNLPEPLNRDRVNYCVQEKINNLKGNENGNE